MDRGMQSGDWRLWARICWFTCWIASSLCAVEPEIKAIQNSKGEQAGYLLSWKDEADRVIHHKIVEKNNNDFSQEAIYEVFYTYANEERSPSSVTESTGRTTYYIVENDKRARLVEQNGEIISRQFDTLHNGRVIESIFDNGNSWSQEDLSNVQSRHRFSADPINDGELLSYWSYSPKTYQEKLIYSREKIVDDKGGITAFFDLNSLKKSSQSTLFIRNEEGRPLSNKCSLEASDFWSWGDLWSSIKEGTDDFIKGLYHQYLNAPQHCLEDFASLSLDRQELETLISELVGDGVFDYLSGYHRETLSIGTVGRGEINDKVRVTFINGILCHRKYAIRNAHRLSEFHGGVNTHYIYWPTAGWTWDISRCLLVRQFQYPTEACIALVSRWKELIEEMGGIGNGGILYHYAHSVGGAESITALSMLSKEERHMIRFITFGSPYLTETDHLLENTHYVSIRDGVTLFDPITLYGAHLETPQHIVFLGNWTDGAPLIDHFLDGQTYDAILKELGAQFVEVYGEINQ